MARATAAMVTSRLRLGFTWVSIVGEVSWLRNAVDGERKFRPRTRVVRRLAVVPAATEAERVVQERLQDLPEHEVRHKRVVIGAVGDDLTLCQIVFRRSWQHLRQVV